MGLKRDALAGEFFWTDRWNGSSGQLLPLEARGLYREMLTQAWARGARLPNNPDEIKRACRVSDAEWERAWPLVERFWEVNGDYLINRTQVDIYTKSCSLSVVRAEAGRKGALSRWDGKANAVAISKPDSKTDGKPNGKQDGKADSKTDGKDGKNGKGDSKSDGGAISKADGKSIVSVSRSVRTNTQQANSLLSTARVSMAELADEDPRPAPDPRRHCRQHVAPMACHRGVCVFPILHEEFIARVGGDQAFADRRLRTFYADVINAIPTDEIIAENAYDFWRRQFAETFGKKKPVAPSPVPSPEETAESIAALRASAPTEEERARLREAVERNRETYRQLQARAGVQ